MIWNSMVWKIMHTPLADRLSPCCAKGQPSVYSYWIGVPVETTQRKDNSIPASILVWKIMKYIQYTYYIFWTQEKKPYDVTHTQYTMSFVIWTWWCDTSWKHSMLWNSVIWSLMMMGRFVILSFTYLNWHVMMLDLLYETLWYKQKTDFNYDAFWNDIAWYYTFSYIKLQFVWYGLLVWKLRIWHLMMLSGTRNCMM